MTNPNPYEDDQEQSWERIPKPVDPDHKDRVYIAFALAVYFGMLFAIGFFEMSKVPKETFNSAPCSNCPFRKDCPKGWLSKERVKEINDNRIDMENHHDA